jgi:hypothetical protein
VSLGKPISDVKLIRKILRSLPERFRIPLNLRKKRRKIPEDPDALNAQALGISGLIAGILKRARGRRIM